MSDLEKNLSREIGEISVRKCPGTNNIMNNKNNNMG